MTQQRQAGVLLHPTSLPNEDGKLGCLNEAAWKFLDWVEETGLSVWQMLPLTEPVQGLSPYQSVSAFALNPALLPEDWQETFDDEAFEDFLLEEPFWLQDYALFVVIREAFSLQSWIDWPDPLKTRMPAALKTFAQANHQKILQVKQQQFALISLWQKLKSDANAKGIQLFGDMPIFVAFDSADVWANPQQFKLDENLNPTVVAGVPPDYFSETGQRWGNPHYDWEAMQKDGFSWWLSRVEESLKQFDWIRIDHFRGLEACWEIDAEEETAMNGCWVKVPGEAFLQKLQEKFSKLPLIAEDLGIITEEVVALKEAFNLPGMSILQFGFNGLPDNPHALNEQKEVSVVYTGTHDNDTTLGWWQTLDNPETIQWIEEQLPQEVGEMPWPLIVAAMQSPAQMMIAPMQDYLSLDNSARMNVPGTVEDNWQWQFDWTQVEPELAEKIHTWVEKTQRIVE